jgi:hypothetical protein
MRKLGIVALALVAAAGAGCPSPDGETISSPAPSEVYCESPGVVGTPCGVWSTDVMSAEACTKGGGKLASSCPSANRLGSCSVTQDGGAVTTIFYVDVGFTAMDAQADCASGGGSWWPG